MAGTLPRFAKTNGETQKAGEVGGDLSASLKRGTGLFSTFKRMLSRSETGVQGGTQNLDPTEKLYFTKANGKTTLARNIDAYAWADHGASVSECAIAGDLDGVKRLLNLGNEIEDLDIEGNSALHHAAEAGFTGVARLLIDRGADCSAKNNEGETPMHKAAINGHGEVIKHMLLGRADCNAKNKSGWTPLHEAACNGRVEVVQTLLQVGADANSRTYEGDTPLHKAARWGKVEVVKLLLIVGVDPHAVDKMGREAMDRTNDPGVIQLLKNAKQPQNHRSTSEAGTSRGQEYGHTSGRKQSSQAASRQESESDDDDVWDVADESELYETQWALFVSNKDPDRKISYSDVPWPGKSTSAADIINVVLHGTKTTEEKKKRLRAELLRWHPDKFQAIFSRNLKDEDKEQIYRKVNEISQALSRFKTSL